LSLGAALPNALPIPGKVYVAELSPEWSDSDLRNVFGPFGDVKAVRYPPYRMLEYHIRKVASMIAARVGESATGCWNGPTRWSRLD
jgi:hypothetical protein